jgi:hypothetical protein
MLSRIELKIVTASVRSASVSMEARFVDMGARLGTAVDTIGTLTQTFDRLAGELKGDNLRDATRDLSQIISRVVTLARVHDNERTAFGKLAELAIGIQRRVMQMGKAVSGIGMLAINARIEAVSIGDAGLDFAGFTAEIGRTLLLAQTSLEQFTAELIRVGGHLRVAAASQAALAQHQAAAIHSVPIRLAESIGAIADRGTRAVAAASAVAQKSRRVGQSISDAVMALQVGDITRQRLEHVEYALSIIAEIMAPPDEVGLARHGDWSGLTGPQGDALANLCGRLLAAQLVDAADDYDRELQQILSSVQELAADAEDILRLGNAAVGASDDRRGTFLGKVEEQVAEVGVLLKGLATARYEADDVAGSVAEATTRLVSHTSTLRSLEEDIRMMGLNTSLKCGRLGSVGRPLMVIAQELRAYSSQIAREASAITVDLDAMMATAGSSSGGDPEGGATGTAAVATIMADSVSRLEAAGESLADALGTLAHDSVGVAGLLRDTVGRATDHEEPAQVLRQAASNLASAAENGDREDETATPEADRALALIMRSYTMERERVVHDRHSNGRTGAMASVVQLSATSAVAPAEFGDVFF